MTDVWVFLLRDVGGNVMAAALVACIGIGIERFRNRTTRGETPPARPEPPRQGGQSEPAQDEPPS